MFRGGHVLEDIIENTLEGIIEVKIRTTALVDNNDSLNAVSYTRETCSKPIPFTVSLKLYTTHLTVIRHKNLYKLISK